MENRHTHYKQCHQLPDSRYPYKMLNILEIHHITYLVLISNYIIYDRPFYYRAALRILQASELYIPAGSLSV